MRSSQNVLVFQDVLRNVDGRAQRILRDFVAFPKRSPWCAVLRAQMSRANMSYVKVTVDKLLKDMTFG
ncbi:hypothetical protein SKAU_G00396290 [Synaphobranchus kaupii]|uniref:Uncharacterized protein n=1 Tax=Synaphobranchus kaupii TaxID=118154 RepID=A0A9Q1IE48_SYNKA|nr:hypothetical protein SKAU_G00396290 [Synaphobranchus kaupii]